MSNFFKNTDISKNIADEIVSETLNSCDDGELYLEDSKAESILLDDKDFVRLRRKRNKVVTYMYIVFFIMFFISMWFLSEVLIFFFQ